MKYTIYKSMKESYPEIQFDNPLQKKLILSIIGLRKELFSLYSYLESIKFKGFEIKESNIRDMVLMSRFLKINQKMLICFSRYNYIKSSNLPTAKLDLFFKTCRGYLIGSVTEFRKDFLSDNNQADNCLSILVKIVQNDPPWEKTQDSMESLTHILKQFKSIIADHNELAVTYNKEEYLISPEDIKKLTSIPKL
jgi:hypothetical protein